MRKLIFLFTLLLSFSLYSATLPQGLIKEEKNGITRITTTNPNFKLVMEINGGYVELKWESIFKNDKGFIYSSPRYGYDYGETISDFGSYKLFTVPIEDFGQVITSPGGYVVPAPYVIDVDHPVYSVNNIRYLIYAFVLDPLESTELYGYRSCFPEFKALISFTFTASKIVHQASTLVFLLCKTYLIVVILYSP